jgi:D-alanyl-D-alanine carboxypeptidase/D-alanyl-D-alanine-endopeptidase (penicillin-binding protein 4)
MRRTIAVALATLLALAGYVTLDIVDKAPGILTLAPEPAPPAPTSRPSTPAVLPSLATPGMPLAPAGAAAPAPTSAGVQAALGAVLADPRLAGRVSAVVRDGLTGAHLLDVAPDAPRVPASVLKLATAAAVTAALPVGATADTTVVLEPGAARVVLVAGGDTLLDPGPGDPTAVAGRAGLATLAAQTAQALRANGIGHVTLGLDLSFGAGPPVAPTWLPTYRPTGITGPVTMLALATHRATPGQPAPADPPGEVLAAFAARLTEAQIAVTVDKAPRPVAAGSSEIARVASAPIADQMALALVESDNALTEAIARQAAARSGGGTDFAGTAAWVRHTLTGLGLDLTGVHTVDASGLSRQNLVPARLLVDVLELGVADKVPAWRATVAALAVGHLTGTLTERFAEADGLAGAGVVRGKTGTLTGVDSLAGTVVTADGRLLTFAVLYQGSGGTSTTRAALDRFGATLATCGCR